MEGFIRMQRARPLPVVASQILGYLIAPCKSIRYSYWSPARIVRFHGSNESNECHSTATLTTGLAP